MKQQAFTLVELIIVIAIIGTLAAIAVPYAFYYLHQTKVTVAISEIRTLERDIIAYEADRGEFPDQLSDLGRGVILDPWGNPYQYLNIASGNVPKGKWRKDRFLVPVNSDFDLYSMGPDGKSVPPFTAKSARDDIVRANDGTYVGKASEY